jgi:hypothetical protein
LVLQALAVRVAHAVDGVVDVVDRPSFAIDDTAAADLTG